MSWFGRVVRLVSRLWFDSPLLLFKGCFRITVNEWLSKYDNKTFFVFFFALACKRIFNKTHCIKSIFVIVPENILFQACVYTFQPGNFTSWGSEGVNESFWG